MKGILIDCPFKILGIMLINGIIIRMRSLVLEGIKPYPTSDPPTHDVIMTTLAALRSLLCAYRMERLNKNRANIRLNNFSAPFLETLV